MTTEASGSEECTSEAPDRNVGSVCYAPRFEAGKSESMTPILGSRRSQRDSDHIGTSRNRVLRKRRPKKSQGDPLPLNKSTQSELNFIAPEKLLLSRVQFQKGSALALWDSGASCEFISGRLAKRLGLPLRKLKSQGSVKTANGQQLSCENYVRVWMTLGKKRYRHCFKVIDMSLDVVLGISFMRSFDFQMDWTQNRILLRNNVVPLTYTSSLSNSQANALQWQEGLHDVIPQYTEQLQGELNSLSEEQAEIDLIEICYGSIHRTLKEYSRNPEAESCPAVFCRLKFDGEQVLLLSLIHI